MKIEKLLFFLIFLFTNQTVFSQIENCPYDINFENWIQAGDAAVGQWIISMEGKQALQKGIYIVEIEYIDGAIEILKGDITLSH